MTETKIQMRFADVDMLGHVNNVNVQHYFDLGKSDFFEQVLGVEVDYSKRGLIIASSTTSYISQIRPRENIAVRCSISKIGNKSFNVYQQVVNLDTQEVKCDCTSIMVAFDFCNQVSFPLPDTWRERLSKEMISQ